MPEVKPTEPTNDSRSWYLRALGIVSVVALAIVDDSPDTAIPPFVYALVVGFVLGVKPSTVAKALNAIAKILQDPT